MRVTKEQKYIQDTLTSIKALSGCSSITYHKNEKGLYGLTVTKYGMVFMLPLGVDSPVLSSLQIEKLSTDLSSLDKESVQRISLDEKAGKK